MIFLLALACSSGAPTELPISTPSVPIASAPAPSVLSPDAQPTAIGKTEVTIAIYEIEHGAACNAVQTLANLYADGSVDQSAFDMTFNLCLVRTRSVCSLAIAHISQHSETPSLRPYLQRYYDHAVMTYKAEGIDVLKTRGGMKWPPCLTSHREFLNEIRDMADAATLLNRAEDARAWRTHHADLQAAYNTFLPECDGPDSHENPSSTFWETYNEYMALGLTEDAKNTALAIGRTYETEYTGERFVQGRCWDDGPTPCDRSRMLEANRAYALAGWSIEKIETNDEKQRVGCNHHD